jgi:hypothetical protein
MQQLTDRKSLFLVLIPALFAASAALVAVTGLGGPTTAAPLPPAQAHPPLQLSQLLQRDPAGVAAAVGRRRGRRRPPAAQVASRPLVVWLVVSRMLRRV